jgi:TonB family protein
VQKPSKGLAFGLGAQAAPGKINLNMNQATVVASIGQDQLRKERVADGERRKSEHRGSFQASNFERWRSAIENYVSTVKPGNQTSLNAARVPFATYLTTIHNRIHPIFADSFLDSISGLPSTHPLANPKLVTHLEIVVGPKDGQIVKMGVVRASGVTAFDIAALDSVKRASPFGPAPNAIVSSDGNVYLHWEFHRDEVFACSTMNARPFMLNLPPQAPPVEPPANKLPTSPTEERVAPPAGGPSDSAHGAPNPN